MEKEKDKKYMKGEKFLQVTFELPDSYDKDKLAEEILNYFKHAVNVCIIPCKIVVEPSRLSVSKDDYSYHIYNSKQKSQIIKERNKNETG